MNLLNNRVARILCLLLLIFCISVESLAKAPFELQTSKNNARKSTANCEPNYQLSMHNIGYIRMALLNSGILGAYSGDQSTVYEGEVVPSCEYPKASDVNHLFGGALWIGAIVGRDTLVTCATTGWENWLGREFNPDCYPAGGFEFRTVLKGRPEFHPEAKSEQDIIAFFTDTMIAQGGENPVDNRPHVPLNISVAQRSYSWSYSYADDFILIDFQIANIGRFPLKEVFMGLYIDGDVFHMSNRQSGPYDDICGFLRTADMPPRFGPREDTVNIAWIADNDGDPGPPDMQPQYWYIQSARGVTGTRVLRTPNPNLKYSFNWWVSNGNPTLDFGPRKAGTDEDPFRSFGDHLGTPIGDILKYYILSHEEFDYDQLYTAFSHTDKGYLSPPRPGMATDIANGFDTRYLLSFGPFNVEPGDTLPITIAFVAGENFHVNPRDFIDNFDAYYPDQYYNTLNFKDFSNNSRWAYWVYDNPGVDTDENGDSGRYVWSCRVDDSILYFTETDPPPDDMLELCDKYFYTGDGVPDFKAAGPPPPPIIRTIPERGKVTIRWNGQISENTPDPFSGKKDFEGYRVYMSTTERFNDFVLLDSYDIENFKRHYYDPITLQWKRSEIPFTLDYLRKLYGPNFNPLDYDSPERSMIDETSGEYLYFTPQDWNTSDLTNPNRIHKVYPRASKDDPDDTTDEGYMRYYEYEYTIDNIQPSIPFYFSVTTFDYGSMQLEVGALESSPLTNAVSDFAMPQGDFVEEKALDVIVYPNPYRIDGGYARQGYENRRRTKSAERTRKINFMNLPNVCKIRIYSIDGDLIKEIEHYHPEGGPHSQYESWDVISRNTQAVVTGIYIWHVSSNNGEQLDKLVIMK